MKKRLICVLFLAILLMSISCVGSKKEEVVEVQALPEINAETETEIVVWCWTIAAKALSDVIPLFNEKYPNIKVHVEQFGGSDAAYQKYGIVFVSEKGMPDIASIESDFVHTFAETYPQVFLDMNDFMPENWESTVDPSKIPTSYDSEGKLVGVPWDSGPVVMFYRADMFEEAGIDPESIETYDDYIAAGKILQEKLPGVKMLGFGYTADDAIWRTLMVQNGTYYLNSEGEITINSDKALEAMTVIKKLVDEGIVLNTVNWDGTVRANKSGRIASYITGGWYANALRDQMKEHFGKFRAMRIPAFEAGGIRASSLGGSVLAITAADPIKRAASWAFIETALMTTEGQLIMSAGDRALFPSYLPVYETQEFLQPDPYFGNQNVKKLLSDITKDILPVIYNSKDYSDIRDIGVNAFEEVINNTDVDIKKVLDKAASQINGVTGRTIANQ